VKPRYTDAQKYPHGYKPACETDIGRTFERIRRQQKANADEVKQKVEPITLRTASLTR